MNWLVCVWHRCPPLDGIKTDPLCAMRPVLLIASGDLLLAPEVGMGDFGAR